jgi:hypothetical protein
MTIRGFGPVHSGPIDKANFFDPSADLFPETRARTPYVPPPTPEKIPPRGPDFTNSEETRRIEEQRIWTRYQDLLGGHAGSREIRVEEISGTDDGVPPAIAEEPSLENPLTQAREATDAEFYESETPSSAPDILEQQRWETRQEQAYEEERPSYPITKSPEPPTIALNLAQVATFQGEGIGGIRA